MTERYHRQKERALEREQDAQKLHVSSGSDAGGLGFFGAIADTVSSSGNNSKGFSENSSGYLDVSNGAEEKRRRLSKRLLDMTEKIEELSNQIYHLQQRIELLERKMGVQKF